MTTNGGDKAMSGDKTTSSCTAPNATRKLAKRVARLIRGAGLTYDQWRQVNRMVKRYAGLTVPKRKKRLPTIPTDEQLRRMVQIVDRSKNTQHAVLVRLAVYTGLRVAELAALKVEDIDLDTGRVRVNQGKGDKDRTTLCPRKFLVVLRTYLGQRTEGYVFLGRQGPYTTRRLHQIITGYAGQAGIKLTPHTLRHVFCTRLTAHGLTDSQIQPMSGHADKRTLAVYQHLTTDQGTQQQYEEAMKDMDI